jgi:hypothetical protein
MRLLTAAVLVTVATALVGCGGNKPKLVSVTGKVTQKGQPVTGGSVWFHPETSDPNATEKMSGQLQIDGTFTAKTFPHGDGVPPGRYKVTLSRDLAARAGVPKYGDPATTPWSVDVPDTGLADHTFEIK